MAKIDFTVHPVVNGGRAAVTKTIDALNAMTARTGYSDGSQENQFWIVART